MLVSCRAIADGLEIARADGLSLDGLTDGLEVDLGTLLDHRAMVDWNTITVVLDRLAERMGGLEAYRAHIAGLADHPGARRVRRFMRLAPNPERTYFLVFRWLGPSLYPSHTATIERVDRATLEIVLEIPEHLNGSLPFLHGAWGTATTLPRMHGLPDARVEAQIDDRRAHLRVHLPLNVSLLGRAQRWAHAIVDAPGAVEELIRQQTQLQGSYAALQDSYAEARERQRQLEAEMQAREQAQEELRRRTELLLHSQRMESVGRLAGGVAHDFNNLLTAILGYTEVLSEHVQDDEPRAAVAEIRSAAERAARLTSQLLTFGRKQPSAPTCIDLNQLVRDLEGLLRRLLSGVQIETRLHDGPLYVDADSTQLEQVIVNLAVNASDAMPDGGVLTVVTEEGESDEGAVARLVVQDTGDGIPDQVVAHIFEPYFTTKGDRGTGLGLATAYGIVSGAGGVIEAHSSPGEGARFVVQLPLRDEPCGPDEHAGGSPGPRVGRGTVLVIEDEAAILALVERALTREGHQVLGAADRSEALGHVADHHIDLVVSDVMLGSDRGPRIVEEIVARQPDVRVMFISGYVDEHASDIPRGSMLLTKPFGMAELTTRVEQLLAPSSD